MNLDRIQGSVSRFFSSAGSLLKVGLLSRKPSGRGAEKKGAIIIMGNGPSLRQTIDRRGEWLRAHDLLAVNFAANTPDFRDLRPGYYVLADGHFFSGCQSDPNVRRLWEALASVGWKMTLWVPVRFGAEAKGLLKANGNVEVKVFNLIPVEGYAGLCHRLIDAGLGMPRPRNVMVPSIITAIREGYRKVYLCGADHTWTHTLSVDDENFVVSVQPHFYKDNSDEYKRVRSAYAGLHLHDVLGSMTVAFRSYWHIADYARSRGVEIINATPGSMIDAFPRLLE